MRSLLGMSEYERAWSKPQSQLNGQPPKEPNTAGNEMFNLSPSKTSMIVAARGGPAKSKPQTLSVQLVITIKVNICTAQYIDI